MVTGPFDAPRMLSDLWQAHRHVGATLTPNNPPLARRHLVVVTFHLGPAHVVAPCRIVYVTDEADRFGFAYGRSRTP